MTLNSFLTTLQDLTVSAYVRGDVDGTEWLFPIIESVHVLSLTLVFGSIAMVDLRLIGLTRKGTSFSRLAAETLPWTWSSWVVAAISGTLMFLSKAVTYFGNFDFRMKFVCMALAAVNMLIFHSGAYRRVADWENGSFPAAARIAGGLSLALWVAVIFFGRWIGFTT